MSHICKIKLSKSYAKDNQGVLLTGKQQRRWVFNISSSVWAALLTSHIFSPICKRHYITQKNFFFFSEILCKCRMLLHCLLQIFFVNMYPLFYIQIWQIQTLQIDSCAGSEDQSNTTSTFHISSPNKLIPFLVFLLIFGTSQSQVQSLSILASVFPYKFPYSSHSNALSFVSF